MAVTNTFSEDDVIPRILAQGLVALRRMAFMPQIVNRKYEREAGMKGSTIDVPVPSALVTEDVTPAATPPAGQDQAPTSVPITLNKWKKSNFHLTDKEQLDVMEGVVPMQVTSAIAAIADTVNSDIFALYKNVYGYVGTAGTTPFASNTQGATNLRKRLFTQLCPGTPRYAVIDPEAEDNALNLRQFQDASWAGDAAAIRDGKVGQRLGFTWAMHQLVPTHTAGTITTGLIAKASTAQAVGLKAIVCHTAASTGACALVIGDIITFAGQTQTYVVTAAATQASANTDVTVNIFPGLQTALTGSEAVTVKGNHTVNLGFHPEAFAFATRPLAMENGFGSKMMSTVDPESGLSLRLEVSRQYKRISWEFDILYGVGCVRPELACRLAG